MTVATVIKSMARDLGISQTELAARARMSRASLSLKLNERRDLTLPEVERLASVLGITVKDLLNRVERAERARDLKCKEVDDGKYAIADKQTGVILINVAHGSIYDEDVPA